MRIAIGGLFHESNTFIDRRTTLTDYEAARLYSGEAMLEPLRGTDTEVGGFLDASAALGFEIVPTFYGWAWPAGPLTTDCFHTLLERLRTALAAAGELDGVLLTLHGAMVAEGDVDPDGTILAEARSCLPPGVPLVATFDLHSNLSPLMVSSCDALIGYSTYPHVDLHDTGQEAAALLVRMLRDGVRPVQALAKPPLMPHIVRQRTSDGPMAELLALARAAERGVGVLRVSVAAGFAYADVPRMGMGVVAITDGDADLAAHVAHDLADAAWDRRHSFCCSLPGAPEAIRQALDARSGTVVLADLADNVGGGSPGDGTELLVELLEALADQEPEGDFPAEDCKCLVLLADPQGVHAAVEAGVGSAVELEVGGKSDRQHGQPVRIQGVVRRLTDGIFLNRGPMRDGLIDDQGLTAVVDCGRLLLVLTERKMPMWNLEQVRSLGVEPTRLRIIVTKGAVAHRAAYEPIAAQMIEVETSGACAGDVRRFSYQQIRRPMFPIDLW